MPTQNIDGVNFHYLDRGRGPVIVLVHGFPLDCRIWESQVEALCDRYRVIAPDLRGFGQTASDESFTIASLADDLHGLLKKIDGLPCVFGGLSMGGYVALAYARKYTADLRGLALIDTRADADSAAGKANRQRMIQLAQDKGAGAIAQEMFPRMLDPDTPRTQPAVASLLRRIMESQSAGTIQNALAAMRDREDYTADLPSVAAPALILVGEHDAITPPAVAETLSRAIRNPRLVIIRHAGHMAPMEQPDDVTTAIRRFAETVCARPE